MQTCRGILLAAFAVLLSALPGIAAAQDPSFYVVNRTGRTINEVKVSSASETQWGPDLLGAEVLRSGQRLSVRPRQCVNDIQVTYDNNATEERRNVNTCNLNEVVFGGGTQAAPLTGADFRIWNRSGRTINEIYVSSSNNTSWGRDRLGNDTLPSGRYWTIRQSETGCSFDLRVTFVGGGQFERRNINACQISEFNIQ